MDTAANANTLAHNVKRLSHLDLPGAGQVYVEGTHCYIDHIPNKQQLGTTILDVADPKNPKILSQIFLDDMTNAQRFGFPDSFRLTASRGQAALEVKDNSFKEAVMQIKTILFPTDFSQGARAAMDYAVRLDPGL